MRIHSWNTALFSTDPHYNLFSIENHCLLTFPETWLWDLHCIRPQKLIPVLSITYLQIRLKSQCLSRYFKGLMIHFFWGEGKFKTRITYLETETSILLPLYEMFTETRFPPLKKIKRKKKRKKENIIAPKKFSVEPHWKK